MTKSSKIDAGGIGVSADSTKDAINFQQIAQATLKSSGKPANWLDSPTGGFWYCTLKDGNYVNPGYTWITSVFFTNTSGNNNSSQLTLKQKEQLVEESR